MVLANSDNQAMHFVVNLGKRRPFGRAHCGRWMSRSSKPGVERRKRCWDERGLVGHRLQGTLKQLPDFLIVRFGLDDPVAFEQSSRVSINDEDGLIASIK